MQKEDIDKAVKAACDTLEDEIIKMAELHRVWKEREALELKIIERENEIVAEIKRQKKYSPTDIDNVLRKRRRKRTEIERAKKKAELEE